MPTPKMIENLAEQVGGGIIGNVMGLMMESHNDQRQINQQRKLSQIELDFNKQMSDYQYQKQLQMWKDTNYSAQVAELEKAGLNPALLYGMGGGGGATTGSGGGGMSGGKAAAIAGESLAMQQQGMQMALMNAQIEKTKAETKQTETNTAKTAGIDTQEAQTRIQSLLQGITDSKQRNALMAVEQELKQLDVAFATGTLDDRIDQTKYQTQRAITELENAQNITYINRQTRDEQIKTIQQAAIGSVLHNALTVAQTASTKQGIAESKSKIQLNTATIAKMAQDVAQGWQHLTNEQSKIATEQFKAEFDANYPGLWDVLGKSLDDGIQEIFDLFKSQRPKNRTIK